MTQEIKEQSIYLIKYTGGWATFFNDDYDQTELCHELDKIFDIDKDCKALELHIHSAGENLIEYTGNSGFLYVGNDLYKKTGEYDSYFLNKKRLHINLIDSLTEFFKNFVDSDDNGELSPFTLQFDLWQHY